MLAPAKINLDLRITGRRADGYHLLDSVVVFTDFGDELTAEPSDHLHLEIAGPFALELGDNRDNLITKAARQLCVDAGVPPNISFKLTKNLPISSGIGGGSSNAAVALKLTNHLLKLNLSNDYLKEVGLKIGADVPVCLNGKATRMTGIGEVHTAISPRPNQPVLLVNPGIAISTASIFSKFHEFGGNYSGSREMQFNQVNWPLMLDHLLASTNDLQAPACALNNEVSEVLTALGDLEGNMLSRMSGSGATCFAVFSDATKCKEAEYKLKKKYKNWWIKAGSIR